MRHSSLVIWAFCLLAAPLALGGCGWGGSAPSVSGPAPSSASAAAAVVELQVYAAASLKRALAAAATAYAAVHPEVTLAVSTDSSSALATKIEQGAPADLFLSADTKQPAALIGRGLAAGPATPYAGNALTVIVPAADGSMVTSPADLGRPGVRIVAAADGVPIAAYTATWLAAVAGLPGYGADFPARFAANVVSREENASAIVTKVGLGEGDAGVVYFTDAAASEQVHAIAIPAEANVRATYAGVVVGAAAHPDAAAAFLAWLAGPAGQAVLGRFGFLPPGG